MVANRISARSSHVNSARTGNDKAKKRLQTEKQNSGSFFIVLNNVAFVTALLAVSLHVLVRLNIVFGPRPYATLKDDDAARCSAVPVPAGMRSTEDITPYRDGVFLLTSGSLRQALTGDQAKMAPGGILALDVTQAEYHLELVSIAGRPTDVRFQPHGFFFSNSTSRLYVVSHPFGEIGSIVEIFAVVPPQDASRSRAPSLSYLGYVKDEKLFRRGGLNDIVEGKSGNDFYVTTYKAFDLPYNGPKGKVTGFRDHFLRAMEAVPLVLLQVLIPATFVTRCTFDLSKGQSNKVLACEKAADRLYASNGITTNPDRTLLFVNDLGDVKVHVYDIEDDGSLTEKQQLSTPWLADNIEYDVSTGKIFAGSVPNTGRVMSCTPGFNHSLSETDNRQSCPVPGGFYEIVEEDGAFKVSDSGSFNLDGTQMSQTSTAVQYNNVHVLGSPYDESAMVCTW